MIQVQLMTLSGKFAPLRTVDCVDHENALAVIEAHAASGGYTNVKAVEDADSTRYTARTPGGRGGRNIAYIDYWQE